MGHRILVVGRGAREHAICWKLAQSAVVDALFCAPGNPGIAEHAELIDVDPMDIPGIVNAARENEIDLVVIGSEDPLAIGITDALEVAGFLVAGPSMAATQLEASKSFANKVMESANVATAKSVTVSTRDEGIRAIGDLLNSHGVVVKADGLAAGKGVVVADNAPDAIAALDAMLVQGTMGEAGRTIVIEERLVGPEVSILCLCDGTTLYPLQPSCDYKRAFDNDEGPNTGGMGNYTPTKFVDDAMMARIETEILLPTIKEMSDRGTPMKGVLFAGLMLCEEGPKVIEFNCRPGDPETEVVLPVLDADLGELLYAMATGTLGKLPRPQSRGAAVGVIMASEGYPEKYPKGLPISGLDQIENAIVFHAGTALVGDTLVTNGGRVLCVVSLGETIADARNAAYTAVEAIEFDGAWKRTDIALREA